MKTVKRTCIQYSAVKQTSILFTSCVKISDQYLGYFVKYSLFNFKGLKSKVTKIVKLGSTFHFIAAILISFVTLNNVNVILE